MHMGRNPSSPAAKVKLNRAWDEGIHEHQAPNKKCCKILHTPHWIGAHPGVESISSVDEKKSSCGRQNSRGRLSHASIPVNYVPDMGIVCKFHAREVSAVTL